MMKKTKAKRPISIETLSSDTKRLFDVLNEESDLACVLIGVSFLDETVRSMLSRFLVDGNTTKRLLDPQQGAIGEFSVRFQLAYCLGIVKKTYVSDLTTLAEIRNLFAHNHLGVTFENKEIQQKCRTLKTPKMLPSVQRAEENFKGTYSDKDRYNDARNRFTITVAMLSNFLLVEGLGIKCVKAFQ